MTQKIKKNDFYIVIMAGGSGTRLWPVSRRERPKQFQKFISSRTMIQETYDRASKVVPVENILISTTSQYKTLVLEQLPFLKENQLIIEPIPRGTAPAIAMVAKFIYKLNPKATVATIASDHAIKNLEEFEESISIALGVGSKNPDKLVTIGINPTFADSSLGYIKMGKEFTTIGKRRIFYIDSFVEKPDQKTAEGYLTHWEYLWNAGYFIFGAKGYLSIVKKLMPKTARAMDKIFIAKGKKEVEKIYGALENEPIDTAVAEKLKPEQRLVVPSELEWSDVGSWGTLFDFFKSSLNSQMVVKGNHIDHGSKNCFIHSEDKLVATIGLENIILIETSDSILVARQDKVAEVKKIIDKLKEQGKHLYL